LARDPDKGGKHADRNQKFADVVDIVLHSVDELRELFTTTGYSDVRVFEEHDWGWICGTDARPRR
jgi:hypothetical protein